MLGAAVLTAGSSSVLGPSSARAAVTTEIEPPVTPAPTDTPTPTPTPTPTDTPTPAPPVPVPSTSPETPTDPPSVPGISPVPSPAPLPGTPDPGTPDPGTPVPAPSDPAIPEVPSGPDMPPPPTNSPTEPPGQPTPTPSPSPPAVPPAAPPAAPPLSGTATPTNPVPPTRPRTPGRPAAPNPAAAAPSRDAARAASALAAAETGRDRAQAAYDAARLALAATLADQSAALTRLEEVRALADAAAGQAEVSARALAALVRTIVQNGTGTATLDALLSEQGSGDLLSRLGNVERIAALTGNLGKIRSRVDRDTQHAATLQVELATAQAATEDFPLAEKQAALSSAEQSLRQATTAFSTASRNAQAALATSAEASEGRANQATSRLAGTLGARLSLTGWATPAVGSLTDGFGPRPELPVPGVLPFHSGTDLAAECGSPVFAASGGVVAQTGQFGTYGNWVLIDHGDGVTTGYAHIADGATLVVAGQNVTAGEVIASVGSTGASTGCHLHVEVRIDGAALDPQPFFADRGISLGVG